MTKTSIPIYEEGLPFDCTGCGGCCTGAPGYVWVSMQEMEAIAQFLELSLEDFQKKYTLYKNGRYSLIEKIDGSYDCIFLEGKRCGIYHVRPTQCKTFPFWPQLVSSHQAWENAARQCEGITKDAPLVPKERIEKALRDLEESQKGEKMNVQEKKWADLKQRYEALGIDIKNDLVEKSVLGSGKGGQKVQKTSNAIFVTHPKSELSASSHDSRSKELNRFLALRKLLEQLEALYLNKKSKKDLELDKKRKQKKRRQRRQKAQPTQNDDNKTT